MFRIVLTLIYISVVLQLFGQSNKLSDTIFKEEIPAENTFANELNSKRIIRGFSIQEENDSTLELIGLKNEDRDYTGGLKMEIFSDYLNYGSFPLIKNKKCAECNYNSMFIQGFGFTPTREVFHLTEPAIGQRPYGSFVGIGRKRIAAFRNLLKSRNSSVVTEYAIAKVGGNGFGDIQNWIHRKIPRANPVLGWHNQIAQGGRLGYYYKAKLNYGVGLFSTWMMFVSPEITRGNLYKNQGLSFSISNRHPADISILEAITGTRGVQQKKRLQLKTYINYLYVQHNTFLLGFPKNDKSTYVLEEVDINKHLVQLGLAFYYMFSRNASKNENAMTIVFELIWRNKEFVNHQSHSFANVGFNYMLKK